MMPQQNYTVLVRQLKEEIHSARIRASLSANVHLLVLYWKIGKAILQSQEAEGWGAKVIDNLAKDLRSEFPDMKGISSRNLKYMRSFAEAYPEFVQVPPAQKEKNQIVQEPLAKKGKGKFVQPPVAQTGNKQFVQPLVAQFNQEEILQQAVAKITWSHNVVLLDRVKNLEERLFYAQQAAEHGWSRNILVHQIESGLYKRKGAAITNFHTTLPKPQSDLAHELLKDPYKFDFLSLGEEYLEKDLENALIEHITKFLLELGAGFSYVGRQYHLDVGGEDFYIDLLFYHLRLRCFVVIELKTGKFIPEYASKLNFYLNVVDDTLKHQMDAPSIGILICKERNKVVAEYSLRGINKPIGVSGYELTEKIPDALKGKLPTIKQIEKELKNINESKSL
jgi:predicted nuclease of restriction endonuclease-like (RecB) superfamily